jgi:hypothetical protein
LNTCFLAVLHLAQILFKVKVDLHERSWSASLIKVKIESNRISM